MKVVFASGDVLLNTNASTAFWRSAGVAFLEKDTQGKDVPNFHGEVRMRWTRDNLYFLFICPYDELYLKPAPNTRQETNELWNWDVAEVFISANFHDIKLYKEFEVSPQDKWIDLDIDLHKPHHEVGWTWNSRFEKTARIDSVAHRWYTARPGDLLAHIGLIYLDGIREERPPDGSFSVDLSRFRNSNNVFSRRGNLAGTGPVWQQIVGFVNQRSQSTGLPRSLKNADVVGARSTPWSSGRNRAEARESRGNTG